MPIVSITDPTDVRLDDFRGLTDTALRRRAEAEGGLYIAESAKIIARACAAGHRPRGVLTQRRWLPALEEIVDVATTPVYLVPDEVAERVTGYPVHRGALASMWRPALEPVEVLLSRLRAEARTGPAVPGMMRRSRIAVFEDLIDHTNIGAAFRSAAALGVDAVLVTPRCADPLYRRAVRVSMGTVFQVPWTRVDPWPGGVDLLREHGYTVAGMTLGEGAITLDELVAEDHHDLALVFGTEGDGLAMATQERMDRRVTIPMGGGVDSLNVAAASAVAFYATR